MNFFSKTCSAICHATANAPAFGGFDMGSAGWEKKLVGGSDTTMATATNMNKCGGMTPPLVYLKPMTQPAQGLFIDKVNPTSPTGLCGMRMPMGQAAVSADDFTCIQNWANNLVGGGTGN